MKKTIFILGLVIMATNLVAGCCQSYETNSNQKQSEYITELEKQIDEKIKPQVRENKKQLEALKNKYTEINGLLDKQINSLIYEYVQKEEENHYGSKISQLKEFYNDKDNVEVKILLERIRMKNIQLREAMNENLSNQARQILK